MAHAHGEIVAWLNSDDYYLPGAVSAAVRALNADPDAVFVYGNMQAVDADGRLINMLSYPTGLPAGAAVFLPSLVSPPSSSVAAHWRPFGALDTRLSSASGPPTLDQIGGCGADDPL